MYFLKNLLILISPAFFLYACVSLTNLSDAKEQVVDYYESGKYEREYSELADKIKSDLEDYKFNKNDAVVFDIDETVLSNYKYIKSLDFGYEHKIWIEYLLRGEAQSIPPALDLFNWFVQRKAKIIFLTGRDYTTYESTRKNLIAQGFATFDTLICRGQSDIKTPAEEFKSRERKLLAEQGYNIIATIGDLYSDLQGDHTGLKFKMPNYLYKF